MHPRTTQGPPQQSKTEPGRESYAWRHNKAASPVQQPPTPPGTAGHPRRIAMLAPPWIPVPPPGYGGIEEVVALLTDALVDRGNDVELFAPPGSSSKAHVTTLLSEPHPESIERALFEADHVARAFETIDDGAGGGDEFDVIHDHSGYTALAMADRIGVPLVHTVHGPFDDETGRYYDHHGGKGHVVCISRSQAGFAPSGARVRGVVFNPIDIDAWPVGFDKQDYLLWVGRFAPEKGAHRAIDVAKRAHRRLILGGVVQPRQERYFAREIEPHLDGEQIQFLGEVGGARKQVLFAEAAAFLMPITWPEPFGMVMVESLAAGTPVLAFPNGAAPEIVEHGRNGFLVRDEEEMAAMVDKVREIDVSECRASAQRFSPDRVAEGYEAAYAHAVERRAGAAREVSGDGSG
jgi:glycosyltransferase involved in cell wall biosynthesis